MDASASRILLVDDEPANLDLLELILRSRGFAHLARVSDARDAARAFDAARPDLVLLDLHMPHRTGFELLDDLRARVPADEFLPVLVLTADAGAQARERALAGGAHDFVTKPFDRTEVMLRVGNLLRTRLLYLAQRRAREAAERAAARDRLLAEAGRVLASTFDRGTGAGHVVRLLVPNVADGAAIDLLDDGTPTRTAQAGDDAATASVLRVPLPAGDAVHGWLTLGRGAARPAFDAEDHALATELAHRVAAAVESARLYQAARDAAAAREQVLAVVAHDLRSPLTAASFDLEMLRLEPERPLGARDRRALARAEGAVRRADRLIADLLDVARLGRAALPVERRPHAMTSVLAEAAEALRPVVEGHGVRFDAHVPDALPTLDVDGPRLVQAVSNLVGNAAKFAAAGGAVTLSCHADADELRIAVRDDGPGIPADQLPHVFGAFWQARHADRRGLGLGLSIALGIVQAHGGRLWAESVVGAGSTFVVALPVAPGRPA